MSRLLLLTVAELATGYRLAGVAVREVASAAAAQKALEELIRSEDGVIAVHAPYFDALSAPLRRRLETLRRPLVVALPAGRSAAKADERRERLQQILRQAVGYELTFGDERTAP